MLTLKDNKFKKKDNVKILNGPLHGGVGVVTRVIGESGCYRYVVKLSETTAVLVYKEENLELVIVDPLDKKLDKDIWKIIENNTDYKMMDNNDFDSDKAVKDLIKYIKNNFVPKQK
jgi:ribosomal protein L24